jgi:hypothetical protein
MTSNLELALWAAMLLGACVGLLGWDGLFPLRGRGRRPPQRPRGRGAAAA